MSCQGVPGDRVQVMTTVSLGLPNPGFRRSQIQALAERAYGYQHGLKCVDLSGSREQPSVPHVITPQAVREVLSSLPGDAKGEQAVAALLQAVSPREVASFVVVREERGCQAEMEGDAASPCSLPAAASQVTSTEVRT